MRGPNGTTEVVCEFKTATRKVRSAQVMTALALVFIVYTRQVTVVGEVNSKPARLGKAQLSFGLIASSRILSFVVIYLSDWGIMGIPSCNTVFCILSTNFNEIVGASY